MRCVTWLKITVDIIYMIDLKNMTSEETAAYFDSIGEKKFRGKQVFRWIYTCHEVASFDNMTDLPLDLRKRLKNSDAYISFAEVIKIRKSKQDGTRKYLLALSDGALIETVFMKYRYGNSICVSSQAGCRMGCEFCASGKNGLMRNLTAGEIADQILTVQRDTGERINHVVVMGTGEPFDNYDELLRFIKIINDRNGLDIGLRNITVSTCGLVPYIERFSNDFPQVNLAISLHAPDDERRCSMMPVNRKYKLDRLVEAAKKHADKTGRRVTYEYALVRGFNDSMEDADKLATLIKHPLCHVNLIPVNELEGSGFRKSTRKRAEAFMERLAARGINATIRRELGSNITINGDPMVIGLEDLPHLLVAGTTGSGKSVFVNSCIVGLCSMRRPDELKMVLVDPKRVEMALYEKLPHILTPPVTDAKKAVHVLGWAIREMERRYGCFAELRVRNLASYNELVLPRDRLPHIVIVVDELADLMMTAPKEVEEYICRLAQMARATGIHLVLATQRPSVNVITGLIKANVPARVAFTLPSMMDSRTILDSSGAEKLLGKGDMLFLSTQYPKPIRVQSPWIDEHAITRWLDYLVGLFGEPVYTDIELQGDGPAGFEEAANFDDALLDEAIYKICKYFVSIILIKWLFIRLYSLFLSRRQIGRASCRERV